MSCRRSVCLCLLCLAFVSCPPAVAATEAATCDLVVMSFNIRYDNPADGKNAWPERRQLVVETIIDTAPDLLGTQECLPAQAAYLRSQLRDYGFVGVGREDGAERGEMCAVFYRTDRFEKLAEGHFWLSETPQTAGSKSWDSALPRMATWVTLEVRGQPRLRFCFFNTHFDHVGQTARTRSAELIKNRVQQTCEGLPVIIAGDFNAPADLAAEGPYRVLAGPSPDIVFHDTYRDVHPPGPEEGTFHAFGGATGGARIDWILVQRGFLSTLAAAILRNHDGDRYPSDHFPVTAAVRLQAWPYSIVR